ncbi:hypothetical protein BOX15_Mlig031963g1, partial [Macrostomum lignano]
TDIPLMPSFGRHLRGSGGGGGTGFVMHWLNNKFLHFTKRSSRQQQQRQNSAVDDAEDEGDGGASTKPASLDDALDRWYQCPDMLFAIHPYDGSFLVWMVEWIDERSSGCYRQAHVSFSSSIPRAFPVGDAISMSSHLILYGEDADVWGGIPAARQQLQQQQQLGESLSTSVGNMWKSGSGGGGGGGKSRGGGLILPCAMILSKHRNGSLNLWQINFAENSSYQTVVSISHVDRMSGHRFRTNNVQCHPVLPLVLTSSQHEFQHQQQDAADSQSGSDFNSELILWRVESVGPLSSSGGMTELARVNSALPTAFTHMAWLPALLPTSVLGSSNRSPGTVFVAFDGVRLRCYMAVIDARSILTARAERNRQQTGVGAASGMSSSTTDTSIASHVSMAGSNSSEIVSLQSASKPGCVVELAEVADSRVPGGGGALILHAFAEPLVTGNRSAAETASSATSTDAQTGNFYLAMLVGEPDGVTRLHVWRITLGKRTPAEQQLQRQQSVNAGSPSEPESPYADSSRRTLLSELSLTVCSAKVASAALALPPGVGITQAAVSAGHLSSASIYPACLSPYLLATVCTDNRIRFWSPWQQRGGEATGSYWREWRMLGDSASAIEVPGQPLSVSCAYSGRIAVAYRSSTGSTSSLPGEEDEGIKIGNGCGTGRLLDIRVAIYEWESTGGTGWTMEDSIHLHKSILASSLKSAQPNGSEADWPNERFVQLDWVSTEDGSHILSVAASTCIQMFAPVSHELATATAKDYHDMKAALKRQGRAVLQQRTKMAGESAAGLEIRWMRLRAIQLSTADDLAPLPMRVAWVREGLLVVGMDNELHVYSQWKPLLGGLGAVDTAPADSFKEKKFAATASASPAGGAKPRSGFVDKRELTDMALSKSAATLPLNRLHSTYSAYSLTEHDQIASSSAGAAAISLAQPQHLDLAAFIQDVGLFEAAQICNPTLPQYHPKKLMELLGFGKFKRIRAILAHLTHCVVEGAQPQAAGDEAVLDIKAVPPLPLYALFEADNDSVAGAGTGSQSGAGADASGGLLNGGANDLFDNAFGDETSLPDTYSHNLLEAEEDDELEAGDGDSPKSPRTQRRVTSTVHQQQGGNRTAFGPATAKLLTEHLMQIQLPGLSRLDQMYLLALAEVVANLQTGLGSDWQPKTGARLASLDDGSVRGYTSTEGSVRGLTDSLDACGLRFFVVLQHHTYLLRTLPPSQRAELAQNGIAAGNLVWAFHSEAQEELLSRLPVTESGDLAWSVMKQYGCGWWVRNDSLLRRCAERAAKAAFQSKQEPLDAAVFYLAMRRVKVIAALYKTVSNQKLQDFFRQDFSQERWRTAALKNAFDLLGKQRFEHAAAFFLLGNSVKDAVEVCVTKLNDLQLAIVLARLHAAEGVLVSNSNQPLADLLNKYVLSPTGRYYSNPFYRSMAHWLLKDYDQAVSTLLLGEPDSALLDQSSLSVFNYFNYLKCHPLILRQAKLRGGLPVGMGGGGATAAVPTAASSASGERMSLTERRLFFRTAHAYFRLGCPSLALEVLTRLPDYLRLETPAGKAADGEQQQAEQPPPPPPPPAKEEDNFLCWNDIGTAADADDDRPPSLRLSSSSDEDIDDDEAMIDKKEAGALENGEAPVDDAPTGEVVAIKDSPAVLDVMTHQLRFVACQRIMSEELSTLATGFEVDGGQLRAQLYAWLERETALLRRLCHYGCAPGEEEDSAATITTVASAAAAPGYGGRKASLVDLGGSLHSRLDSWQRRKLWLRDNEQLLRTLLSFCSLHGASGGGLTSVRMELVLLLQELLQDNLTDAPLQLEAKMPLPNSLPLINAAVSSFKTVVADPIRQLQNLIGDVLGQLRRWASPPELPANAQELFLLRSISAAVSACVYQCLVDSVGPPGDAAAAAGFTTSLVYGDYYCLMSRLAGQRTDALSQGAQQQQLGALRDAAVYAYGASQQPQEDLEAPNTQPSKWPGIAHLRSLLERHKDDDVPRLNIILTEAFLSVYLATLSYGLTTANAKILHRLVARSLTTSVWGAVFGGGLKTPQRPAPMRISGSPAGSGGHALSSGVVIAGGGASPRRQAQQQQQQLSAGGIPRVTDEMSKQRVKLYLSTVQGGGAPPLPPPPQPQQHQQPSPATSSSAGGGGSRGFTERFVQPRASILGCLLAKLPPDPRQPAGQAADFDSANVSENDDADDDTQDDEHAEAAPDEIPGFGGSMADLDADRSYRSSRQMRQTPAVSRRRQAAQERREYAWLLMRCACVRVALDQVGRFLPQVGLELSDLPVESPALYNAVKRVHQWQRAFRDRLRRIGQPPDGFLGGGNSSFVGEDSTFQPARLLMERYKLLLDAERTPFPGQSLSERLCNRLWAQLVRKEAARDVFAKFAFPPPPMSTTSSQQQQQKSAPPRPPPPTLSSAELTEAAPAAAADLPVALVHDTKGEAISSFCLSRANQNCLTLATSKELVELDICDLMLHPFSPAGLDDEDYGGLASATVAGAGGFVGDAVGQLDSDQLPRLLTSFAVPGVTPVPTLSSSVIKGWPARLITRRSLPKPRQVAAHPDRHNYLFGSASGAIDCYEWSHRAPLTKPGSISVGGRVTALRFNVYGNRFAVGDSEGYVSLWHWRSIVGAGGGGGAESDKPYRVWRGHSRGCSDLLFAGCSTLYATGGTGAESEANAALWDTLLPVEKSVVQRFFDPALQAGCTSLAYAPQRQLLLAGTAKGGVALLDLRKAAVRHAFQAHEPNSAVTTLCVDPSERLLLTGSADGSVRAWRLGAHEPLACFRDEHVAPRSLLRSASDQGVQRLELCTRDGHCYLFSCGCDGTVKLRPMDSLISA